jgi:hypothetical protein
VGRFRGGAAAVSSIGPLGGSLGASAEACRVWAGVTAVQNCSDCEYVSGGAPGNRSLIPHGGTALSPPRFTKIRKEGDCDAYHHRP